MSKTWFRVHRFWGWHPVSWQGWLTVSAMTISIVSVVLFVDLHSHSVSDTLLGILPPVSLLVAMTVLVALLKGERPQFGKDNNKTEQYSPDNPEVYLLLPILSLLTSLYYLAFSQFLGAIELVAVTVIMFVVYKELTNLVRDE